MPCAVYKVPGQAAIVLVCLIAGTSHKMNNIADTFLAHKKKREFIRFIEIRIPFFISNSLLDQICVYNLFMIIACVMTYGFTTNTSAFPMQVSGGGEKASHQADKNADQD